MSDSWEAVYSPSGEEESTKTSRRGFLKAAGLLSALTAAGKAGASAAPEAPARSAGRRTLAKAGPGPAMRSPGSGLGAVQQSIPRGGTVPSAAVIALNRMGFGPRPGDIDAFNALGATDAERMQAYVTQQLDPGTIDDSDADARIAAAGFTTLSKSLEQLWQDHVVADPEWAERMRPLYETENLTFLRAIYSRRQLVEVLAEFWHNHFSVYAQEGDIGPVWVHYDREVIRANLLGNFREMLGANTRSTAMMHYLDQYESSADGPNENYAREVMELHTLGSAAYYGVIPQNQVPTDGQGVPLGFVEEDVFAATRALTGWTIRNRPWDPDFGDTGVFFYYPDWHDEDPKTVLGVNMPAAQGPMADGEQFLDRLATHPATGRFIATKLCRRLIGDNPPQNVVDQAAALFTAQAAAPDQLQQVVELILLSPEFLQTFGEKVKRPFEIVVSAMRALSADFGFRLDDPESGSWFWRYNNTGHELFGWHPPNGYPDVRGAWVSTTPRVMSWRFCMWLYDWEDDLENYRLDAFSQTPPGVRSANALADFWIDRMLGRPMAPADRQEIVEFMAQGFNPDLNLPLDTDELIQDRLQAMVGLIFLSPEFLWR